MERWHSFQRLGVELHHLLRLCCGLRLVHLLLLRRLIGSFEQRILRVEEADEHEVEVLVGLLLHQIAAQPSESFAVLLMIHMRLENVDQDVEAVLLWRQFGSLHGMDL